MPMLLRRAARRFIYVYLMPFYAMPCYFLFDDFDIIATPL